MATGVGKRQAPFTVQEIYLYIFVSSSTILPGIKGGAVYSTGTGNAKVYRTRFQANYLDFATGQFSNYYSHGGAICSENRLEVAGCILDKNKCTSGGAIWASGKLKLINNTFTPMKLTWLLRLPAWVEQWNTNTAEQAK